MIGDRLIRSLISSLTYHHKNFKAGVGNKSIMDILTSLTNAVSFFSKAVTLTSMEISTDSVFAKIKTNFFN